MDYYDCTDVITVRLGYIRKIFLLNIFNYVNFNNDVRTSELLSNNKLFFID